MSLPQHQADVEDNGCVANEHSKSRGMSGMHVPHLQVPKKPEKPPMSLHVKNRKFWQPLPACHLSLPLFSKSFTNLNQTNAVEFPLC
jgi:hypothetical protein